MRFEFISVYVIKVYCYSAFNRIQTLDILKRDLSYRLETESTLVGVEKLSESEKTTEERVEASISQNAPSNHQNNGNQTITITNIAH